jgi:hypothetical protein
MSSSGTQLSHRYATRDINVPNPNKAVLNIYIYERDLIHLLDNPSIVPHIVNFGMIPTMHVT